MIRCVRGFHYLSRSSKVAAVESRSDGANRFSNTNISFEEDK